MKGLILIDKPKGITSNQISLFLKKLLKTKTAHIGTLDPNVTGVLPVLIGKAIKIQEFLQTHDKEYVCIMKTDKKIPKEEIKKTFKEFTGKIYQKPPDISAVAKKTRIRRIYSLDLIETKNNFILFKTFCQHGTYIRKLVTDFGLIWNTKTEMIELRRTNAGGFTEQETNTLNEIRDALALKNKKPELLKKIIKPIEYAVKRIPSVKVKNTAVKNIQNGAPVYSIGIIETKGDIKHDKPVAIFNEKNKLIAIGISLYDKKDIKNNTKVIQTKKVIT